MNKAQLDSLWQRQKQIFNNARRQIDLIPENKLDFKPTPEVRSVKELAMHTFEYVTVACETVIAGKYEEKKPPEIKTKAELLKWIDQQIETGYALFAKITDAQLAATIEVWGMQFPAWQMLSAVSEELLHHRGQITVYQRLLGITPISIYEL